MPPKLVAGTIHRMAPMNRSAVASSAKVTPMSGPWAVIWRATTSRSGWSGSPGYATAPTGRPAPT